MATVNSISRLSIMLTMDSTSFDRGMVRASQKVRQFGQMMTTGFADWMARAALSLGAVTAAAFGFRAAINQITSSADRLDRLAKIVQRFGVDAESFRILAVVAADAGVGLEELAKAMNFMSKTIGSGGMTLDKRMAQVAKEVMAIQDPAERVAMAMKIFGKSGAELLPFLEDLATGDLEKAGHIIERFGLTISGPALKDVERMNDAFSRLTLLFTGWWDKFTSSIAPGVAIVIEQLISLLDEFSDGQSTIEERWGDLRQAGIEAGIKIAEAMKLVFASLELVDNQINLTQASFSFLIATINRDKAGMFEASARYIDAAVKLMHAQQAFDDVLSGSFGSRLREQFSHGLEQFSGIVGEWHVVADEMADMKFAGVGALERGSTEAVRAITQSQLASPLAAIEKNTAAMLTALRGIREDARLAGTELVPVTGGG